MKKHLLRIFLCLCIVLPISAQKKYLGNIQSGEFVYFIDQRAENLYARGYLVFHFSEDRSMIFSKLIDLKSGKNARINFVTTLDEHGVIKPGEMGTSNESGIENPVLLQNVIDFLNYATMYQSSSGKITENCVIEDPWNENFSLWYHFSSALPFLGFDKIAYDKECSKVGITAYCYGKILLSSEDFSNQNLDKKLEKFFNYDIKPFVEKERNSGSVPPKAKKMKVELNGYKISLDENWKETTFENNKAYQLEIQSPRESIIMIEKTGEIVSVKTESEKLEFCKKILPYLKNLIPTSVRTRFDKKDLIVEYYSYDDTDWLTYTRLRITDDGIINFNAYKDVFEANKNYFETILSSIKK